MCLIFVAESHDQILELWRSQHADNLKILHLDFHCDMRGLLIDRNAKLAYRTWDMKVGVDQGNFLTHAFFEGRIKSIRWVHDIPGGRQDDVGTVKFESDLTAIPFRLLHSLKCLPGRPIDFDVIRYSNWKNLNIGENLDIDWDFFACTTYPSSSIQERVEAFLARDFSSPPQQVYICYSPDFSHPSRDQFLRFVDDLAHILKAELIHLQPEPNKSIPKPFYKKYFPSFLFKFARYVYYRISLGLHKRGIY